jgi:two-component system, response regulator YesN
MLVAIDDSPEILLIIKRLFEKKMPVETFANPVDAIRFISEHRGSVHTCITDYQMPQMKGDAVAARVREIDGDISVIMISGFEDFDWASGLIKDRKIDEFQKKPVDFVKLLDTIERRRKIFMMKKMQSGKV